MKTTFGDTYAPAVEGKITPEMFTIGRDAKGEPIETPSKDLSSAIYAMVSQWSEKKRKENEEILEVLFGSVEKVREMQSNGWTPVVHFNHEQKIERIVLEPYTDLARPHWDSLPKEVQAKVRDSYRCDDDQIQVLAGTVDELDIPELAEHVQESLDMAFVKEGESAPMFWMESFGEVFERIECRYTGKEVKYAIAMYRFERLLEAAKKRGNTIHLVGNGGSASICDHIAEDLMKIWRLDARTYTAPGLITCLANDYGWVEAYGQALARSFREDDVLIVLSSSGNSTNIKMAMAAVYNRFPGRHSIVTLTGMAHQKGRRIDNQIYGEFKTTLDFLIPSHIYGHVEVASEAILHSLIDFHNLGGR